MFKTRLCVRLLLIAAGQVKPRTGLPKSRNAPANCNQQASLTELQQISAALYVERRPSETNPRSIAPALLFSIRVVFIKLNCFDITQNICIKKQTDCENSSRNEK